MSRSKRSNSVKALSSFRLKSSAEKRLLGYAALATASGVGILALAQPSEAEVVYTPAHVSFTHNTFTPIDIDGDGVNDFTVRVRSSAPAITKTFSTLTSAAMLLYPAVNANRIWGTNRAASVLPPGVIVGPNGKFTPDNSFMGGASALNGGTPRYNGPWAPPGGTEKNQYVGLKFLINGEVHLGWARFSVKVRTARKGGVTAVLTGYAYETVAKKPIVTGRTSGADGSGETSAPAGTSLGDLALGAASGMRLSVE